MGKRLEELVDEVAAFVVALPAEQLDGPSALTLVKMFEVLRRSADAGHALAAEALRRSGIAPTHGAPDASTLIARETGITGPAAKSAIALGQALAASDDTRQAMVDGTLDAGLALDIAEAGQARPEAVPELLAAAADPSVSRAEVRDQARRIAAGWRPEERAAHARRKRSLTWGVRTDGIAYLSLSTTPEVLAVLKAGMAPYLHEATRTHRRERSSDTPEQVRADAFEAMAADVRAGRCGRGGPRAMVSLRVDATALERGHLVDGEVCEIPGVGPVDLDTARALLGHSAVELVIRRGKAIATTCTLGRTMPAGLRTAALERDGRRCVVPGCGNRLGLELDHVVPLNQFGGGGRTELSNLATLCRYHHQQKTRGHRTLTQAPDGGWRWETTRRGELEADLHLPAWDHDPQPPPPPTSTARTAEPQTAEPTTAEVASPTEPAAEPAAGPASGPPAKPARPPAEPGADPPRRRRRRRSPEQLTLAG